MNDSAHLAGPSARVDDLVITESGQDLLVFDSVSNELHHLDALSATVWRQLDGQATEQDILESTRESLGEHVTADSIDLAIVALGKANLLSGQVPTVMSDGASSRRRFLKRAGLAASVPVIASVTAPLAAHAATVSNCPAVDTECTTIGDTICCDCGNGLLRLGVGVCLVVGPVGVGVCLGICAL